MEVQRYGASPAFGMKAIVAADALGEVKQYKQMTSALQNCVDRFQLESEAKNMPGVLSIEGVSVIGKGKKASLQVKGTYADKAGFKSDKTIDIPSEFQLGGKHSSDVNTVMTSPDGNVIHKFKDHVVNTLMSAFSKN